MQPVPGPIQLKDVLFLTELANSQPDLRKFIDAVYSLVPAELVDLWFVRTDQLVCEAARSDDPG